MCKFCEEINKDLIVHELNSFRLVANFFPMGDISLMAIPKRHVTRLSDLHAREVEDMVMIISIAQAKIRKHTESEGFNVFFNEGKIAGQTIDHFHVHIVSRKEGDGLTNFGRAGEKTAITEDELQRIKSIF